MSWGGAHLIGIVAGQPKEIAAATRDIKPADKALIEAAPLLLLRAVVAMQSDDRDTGTNLRTARRASEVAEKILKLREAAGK